MSNTFFSRQNIDVVYKYTRQSYHSLTGIDIESLAKKDLFQNAILKVMNTVYNETQNSGQKFKTQKDLNYHLNKNSIESSVKSIYQAFNKKQSSQQQTQVRQQPTVQDQRQPNQNPNQGQTQVQVQGPVINPPIPTNTQEQNFPTFVPDPRGLEYQDPRQTNQTHFVSLKDDNLVSKITSADNFSEALEKMKQDREKDNVVRAQEINFAQEEERKLQQNGLLGGNLPTEQELQNTFEPNKNDHPTEINSDLLSNFSLDLKLPSLPPLPEETEPFKFRVKDISKDFKLEIPKDKVYNSIELVSAIVPRSGYNIPVQKYLHFKESNNVKVIEIPKGNYTKEVLTNFIKTKFVELGMSSYELSIDPLTNYLTIESKPEAKHTVKKFELLLDQPNSIAKYIGFEERKYSGEFKYISSSAVNLNYQNYLNLFVPELSKESLFIIPLEKSMNFITRTFENQYLSKTEKIDSNTKSISISFKDPFNTNYNFNGSEVLLEFQFKLIN